MLDDSELAAIFRNFASLQKDCTALEAKRFIKLCDQQAADTLSNGGADAIKGGMTVAGVEALCSAADGAMARCIQGSGGVCMEGVLVGIEQGFTAYFKKASATVTKLALAAGGRGGGVVRFKSKNQDSSIRNEDSSMISSIENDDLSIEYDGFCNRSWTGRRATSCWRWRGPAL